MKEIVPLHVHDHWSLLDGKDKPADYMSRMKELGITHAAQTNHGTLAGWREWQREAKKAGIIPILGVEAYISATDRFDKRSKARRTDGTNVYNHLIILAQNEAGMNSLQRLNELAWIEGFYSKPRLDFELLEEHNEGLIVLSGCLSGLLAKAIDADDMETAYKYADRFKSIFPGRFYIEIQGHNPAHINAGLLHIADKKKIPPVVTSDCHYARPEELWIEEAMLILSTNPKPDYDADFKKSQKMDMLERFNYLYPDRTMTFQEYQIYLKSAQEHRDQLKLQGIDREDVITNTHEIANSIGEYPYHEALDLLPRPKGNPDDILRKKVMAGLKKRGLDTRKEYLARTEEELDIIIAKNFSTYFLIVENMVTWAREQGIRVGPGRGSGAGSLVNHALFITDVDPIENGLLFFRFINPERNDFPDIDVDFQKDRRHEVKDYLRRKFKNVASIATFQQFGGKSAVRDAARVFRVPLSDVNKALKNMDLPPSVDFMSVWSEKEQGKTFIKRYPEVIKLAKELEGHNSRQGMHASGLVVAKEPVNRYGPMETAKDPNDKTGPRVPVLAMDMNEAADIGLIKLDVLGLKTLAVIDQAVALIETNHGVKVDTDLIDRNDSRVYAMLNDGYTQGVFQCEGHTFTNWIIENGMYEFNDLVIGTSVSRPGAKETVGEIFKRRRKGREKIAYVHDIMKEFTEETLGCIVYQEQVMQALMGLGGMSGSRADKVRKIIGKKLDVSEFKPYMDEFVDGASKHIGYEKAEDLWHDFEKHAGYSFNKSHAYAYSILSYWTAWFKYHYPKEFMAALLSNEEDKDKLTDYLIEAKRLGIKVLLPHVNHSEVNFSVEGDGIRFGLFNIKYVANSANALIQYRPYENYAALVEKVEEKGSGLTSRTLKALDAVGAAAFPDNPRRGDERDNFYEYLQIPAFEQKKLPPRVQHQFRALDEYDPNDTFCILAMVRNIKKGEGWARIDVLDETGSVGIFAPEQTPIEKGQMYAMLVSNNRVARYAPLDELKPDSSNTFVQYLWRRDLSDVTEGFYHVVSFQSRIAKTSGKQMADMVIADADKNMIGVVVFPQKFISAYSKCKEGHTVMMDLGQTKDGSVVLEKAG